MVAIKPIRGKRNIRQLTLNFYNHYILELEECDELINARRLAKWKEKDVRSDS